MIHEITKDKLESIRFDEESKLLEIKWFAGGNEGAACGLIFKVDLVSKIITDYKSPHIPHNPNYNEAF